MHSAGLHLCTHTALILELERLIYIPQREGGLMTCGILPLLFSTSVCLCASVWHNIWLCVSVWPHSFMWYRYPGMLALLTVLTTSQRDTLAWRAPRPVMPTPRRSLRYQYPQHPHIATLRAGRQAVGWVCHCVRRHPLCIFMFDLFIRLLALHDLW